MSDARRPYTAPMLRRLELAEVLERKLDRAFDRPIVFRGQRLLVPFPKREEEHDDKGNP